MSKILVVYFSRIHEQYAVGNITQGNTAILAEIIAKKTGADIFEVKLKHDNYPTEYKKLTEVAGEEKKSGARPQIVGGVKNFADYDVVFLGTPNWWSDLPMAMYTFMESHIWKGKKILPFVTHEGSGLATIPQKIAKTTGAEILSSFELYGHIAQNEREKAEQKIDEWLKKIVAKG